MAQISYGTITITDTSDISKIENWYLATDLSSGVTRENPSSGHGTWSTTIQSMTSTFQYLWNYEKIYGTGLNNTHVLLNQTNPIIIGRYGQNGENGVSITSIDEYYKANNSSSEAPTSWNAVNVIDTPTASNRFLWNYQVINYSNGNHEGSAAEARIIGVYGEKGEPGTPGVAGINTATVYLYQRKSTTPSKPTNNLTYTFATKTLSGTINNGWSTSLDSLTGTDPIWIIAAVASSNGETDVITGGSNGDWSVPIKLAENGVAGLNQATVYIYQRAASVTKPANTTDYKFSDGSFTVPTNWSSTIPASSSSNKNPCWVTSAVAIGSGATATLTWVTPSVLVENGENGTSPTVVQTSNGVQITDADGNVTTITNGTNGQSYYTHIRYATDSSGSNMSSSPSGKTYIGVYSGTSSSAPATANSYTWSKYVGADGVSVTAVRELYYLTTGDAPSKPTTSTTIYSDDRTNAWTSVVPSYIANGKYYVSLETSLSSNTKVFSDVILDQATTNANANALSALNRATAKYGSSSTAATTAAKDASCSNFELFNGAEIFIKFTNKNNVANPTLNVNNTGAKSIRDSDGNVLDSKFYWKDGSVVHFVYDGSYWRILDIVTTEKYNTLVSDINGISQTVGQHTTTLGSLETRVGTAETNISQNASAISLKANSSEVYTKTATDGLISTEVENRNAAITAKANEISQTVSTTYATKASLDDINNNLISTYAISSTSIGTQKKEAIITPNVTSWSLYTGATITVKFTVANTHTTPSLSIKPSSSGTGTTAKPIRNYSGGTLSSAEYTWSAGATMVLIYDGNYWRIQDSTELTRLASAESSITQNANNIALKVSEDDFTGNTIISKINLNSTTATISADRVEIEGATIFTSGRLSTTNLNDTIDGRIPEIPDDLSDLSDSTGIIPDVSKTFVSATTLYYASNSTTAPSKPTSHISTNNTNTRGQWNIALPTYSESYPYLYICTEYKTKDNTYSWTSVEQTSYSSAISAIKTNTDAAIKSQVNLYYASDSTTPPNKPTAHVTTNSTSTYGQWNIALPTYSATYPYLYTCKETVTNDGTYAWTSVEQSTYVAATAAIKNVADAAAPKSSAVAKTQQIYYRSNSSTKPTVYPTAWVTAETNKWNNGNVSETNFNGWRRKVTPISDGTGANVTKYLYLWTATQKQLVDGTVVTLTANDIALDDSTTVIDGGKIITGSIDANRISTSSLTANLTISGAITTNSNRITHTSTAKGITITSDGISAGDGSSRTFYVNNSDGAVYVKGAITATSLTLGSGVQIPASTGISGLSTVATSGSYNDLNNKPTIPSLTGYIYIDGQVGNTPAEGATGFVVETGGLLKASNAIIYGTLYSSAGTIGGWTIKSNVLSSSTTSTTPGNGVVILSKGVSGPTVATGVLPANQTWAITASNQFGVTTAGKLYATGAEISGEIKADSGYIASGIKIGSGGTTTIGDVNTTANNASYSVEIEVSSIDYTNNSATLVAHPYFKGIKLTSTTTPALNTITGYTWTRADGASIPSGVTTNTKTLQLPNDSDLQATYICTISNAE